METMEEDALASYLNALSRDECYRVESTLKSDNHETTELVFFAGSGGAELGPFIRKRIDGDAGLGHAYRELFEVQKEGKRFLHLPRIYDVHERDGELIVIMEYVIGRTLHEEVYERDASLGLACELFPVLCDGVIELHEGMPSPIIHRDLKPTNIIISKNGLTIIDFGIARTYREDATSDTTQFGTRVYAPPEQFGYGQTDVRSDVYALGLILYYMLREENPSPSIVNAHFPHLGSWPELQMVVRKATAFDPASRYSNVRELKQAFLQCAEKERYRVQRPPLKDDDAEDAPASSFHGEDPGDSSRPLANGSDAPAAVRSAMRSSGEDLSSVQENVPSARVALQGEKRKASPSEIIGLVWDGFVAAVWLFMMIILVCAAVFPPKNGPIYPAWFLIVEYIAFAGLFVTGVSYGVMDKRWLRRHISFMQGQTFGKSWIFAGLLLGVSLLVLFILILIVGVTGNFGNPPTT